MGDSWDEVRVASLEARLIELERRVRWHEDFLDTFLWTPAWKRWLFMVDGWSGHRLQDAPAWRPWRRWWRS